jgi:hypothetical protein
MGTFTSRSTTHGKVRDFGNARKASPAGDKLFRAALALLSGEKLKAVVTYCARNAGTVGHVAVRAEEAGCTAQGLAHELARVALGFGG